MQHTLTNPPAHSADFDPNPTFNVVIAYEDFESGKHAKRTYDYLAEHLGQDCQFSNQMWKFDVLTIPKLRQLACADAAAADIVVVSCQGDELPDHVKLWVESWLAKAGKPWALVALFDRFRDEPQKTQAVRSYLAAAAQRGGMEYFAQPDRRSVGERRGERLDISLNQKALSTLAGVVKNEAAPSRWGYSE
jgi:hypothetical protein